MLLLLLLVPLLLSRGACCKMRIFYYLGADRRIEICILACCPCVIKVCGTSRRKFWCTFWRAESIMIFLIFVARAYISYIHNKCQCNDTAREPAIRPQLSLFNHLLGPRSVTPLEFLIKAKHQTKGNKMSWAAGGAGSGCQGECKLKCQPGSMEI